MKRGFTLIELVMVIVILGILAATALPRFVDLSAKARENASKGVLGGMRAAIAVQYASNAAYGVSPLIPANLTAAMFQDGAIPKEVYSDSNVVTTAAGGTPAAVGAGWYYDVTNGRVYINNSDYTDY